MGQLISLIAVALFSLSGFAQGLGALPKTDFSPLIDQNVLEQELAADDMKQSTLTAANAVEGEPDLAESDLVESVKTIPAESGVTPATADNPATTTTRVPANDKDFKLKLHPTGIASAKRYFPPKPKVVKAPKRSSAKVAKSDKKATKSKKAKGNGRSTASVKKKSKKTASAKI